MTTTKIESEVNHHENWPISEIPDVSLSCNTTNL